ncbi:hypothetical protein EYF80_037300 [Liparis tanakae]|uniref:Uncharacterized protein n=1 Tax=Liparis tanakae TaxID=230148 RepID=A0A4Z2GHY7_9TELE|nr:hypothetical protein EYF80_037300 [Liparis tanakae]
MNYHNDASSNRLPRFKGPFLTVLSDGFTDVSGVSGEDVRALLTAHWSSRSHRTVTSTGVDQPEAWRCCGLEVGDLALTLWCRAHSSSANQQKDRSSLQTHTKYSRCSRPAGTPSLGTQRGGCVSVCVCVCVCGCVCVCECVCVRDSQQSAQHAGERRDADPPRDAHTDVVVEHFL